MRNLELLEVIHKLNNDSFSKSDNFAQIGELCYFIQKNTLYKYDFNFNIITEICPQPFENVIAVKALLIEGNVCVTTDSNIFIVDPEQNVEVISIEFPNTIGAISWNPTEELVAVVFENGDVHTYNIDYQGGQLFPDGQCSINSIIPDTVYVGWGSKDTQFRGSEGKVKADQNPVKVEPVVDQKPTISWRGNGEMFIVNYWQNYERKFVVFEVPCKAIYRSEECPGLQSPIAWRPAGNMIAALTEVAGKESVVIFEKNGQKRFTFEFEFDDVKIIDLKWSPCATILSIHSKSTTSPTFIQNIHLLTSSNYKWYQKQTLTFTSSNPLLDFFWQESTQFTYTLNAITHHHYIKYTFQNQISKHEATCGVINGKNLQITNFKESVVPPILCTKNVSCKRPINFAIITSDGTAVVDCTNSVIWEVPQKIVDLSTLIQDLLPIPLACHHFFITNNQLYFVAETQSGTLIFTLNQNNELTVITSTNDRLRTCDVISQTCEIVGLTHLSGVLYINSDLLPNLLRQSVRIVDETPYNFQMTSNCHLYVNDTKISDSVNSFVISSSYLLFTTKLNDLYCVRLNTESLEALITGQLSKNYRRTIEQGAILISAIGLNSPKVVLQMPRGNLETISCRLISIDILDQLFNEKKWEEALRFIRLEKLNANLIFDLNPERFLAQIDLFISVVKAGSELNSICLEFEDGNVLNKLYVNWGKTDEYPGKIKAIFSAILKYFNEIDYAPYISTIMIINLQFFSLTEAMYYVQDLLKRSQQETELRKSVSGAVNTLKTYGCDDDKLYTEALLLYDLELAQFVASCCQMDPRIYEPYIATLQKLPEVEKRYEINVYGKRPRIAIKYLLRSSKATSDNILNFIKNHRVSRDAYEGTCSNSPHYQLVCGAFADDLTKKGCHYEAGMVLKKARLVKGALEAFQKGLRWREVWEILVGLDKSETERVEVMSKMGRELVERGEYKEAAVLYEFYSGGYEMAVKVLVEGCFYGEALHVLYKNRRTDLIESEVTPALLKHRTYLQEKLLELDNIYNKYRERLAQVRKSKADRFGNFSFEGDDRDDLFSDAGSIASTRSSKTWRSRSSTASSRNRRKEERKKQDLREGGVFEDIALIRALHCTIKEIYGKNEEVKTSCTLLLQESDIPYTQIKNLYDLFRRVSENVNDTLLSIWPAHFYLNNHTQDVQELADLENLELLDDEFRRPPNKGVQFRSALFD